MFKTDNLLHTLQFVFTVSPADYSGCKTYLSIRQVYPSWHVTSIVLQWSLQAESKSNIRNIFQFEQSAKDKACPQNKNKIPMAGELVGILIFFVT